MEIDLRVFGGSALTDELAVPKHRTAAEMSQGIPITYVPARNTIFLAYALAFAEVAESQELFIGVNALDYSGYPDCRPEYIHAFEAMANLATKAAVEGRQRLQIHAPLIHLSKAQIILERPIKTIGMFDVKVALHPEVHVTVKANVARSDDEAELQSQGEAVDDEKIRFLRSQYGLDQPIWVQYLTWVWGLMRGDLGYSFEYGLPVSEVVGDRLSLTVIVSVATILFTYVVAFPIGVYSATRQYSIGDYALTLIGFLGLATPSFLFALVLLYLFNVHFGISIGGLMDPVYLEQPWSWGKFRSVLEHLIVPVIVIGASGTAAMVRRLRANLLDELQKPYVVTARAKGLPPGRLLLKYPLRMALNPFISDIGSLLPQVVSGAAIVSVVLSLPTTGPMLLDSLRSQDMYLAGSFLMFLALLTVVGVLLSDFALAALDPRIRFGAGGER